MTARSVSASPPYGTVESFAHILRKSVRNPDHMDGCALSLVQALAVDEYLEASMKVERIVNVIAAATVVEGELTADPTGQSYSRADDGELPQPSAGREPLHTGAVTDDDLVDESAEDERCEVCGESLRDIARGTLGHIPGEICNPVDNDSLD